jgi:hypothetical protein
MSVGDEPGVWLRRVRLMSPAPGPLRMTSCGSLCFTNVAHWTTTSSGEPRTGSSESKRRGLPRCGEALARP